MSSNEPVKNGCEVIYETFHISPHYKLNVLNVVLIQGTQLFEGTVHITFQPENSLMA